VALASGFDSLRRFNAAFVEHYRLNPSHLRAKTSRGAAPAAGRHAAAGLPAAL
jgi:AraC family transcriptional regulator of adaptative response / DNA-3-methyladenine glycosylase II